MKESVLRDKSYLFAVRVVKLAQYLQSERQEFVLYKQIMRSGTAIGAMVREAEFAQSKADFVSKMNIALKEANEAQYWLLLLHDTGYLEPKLFQSLESDCREPIALLVSTVRTSQK